MNQNNGEIILYQPDNNIRLEVRMHEETVWLTQAQMGQLFDCSTDNISLHLKNLYAEGEIELGATSEEISVVRQESRLVSLFAPRCLPPRAFSMTGKSLMPTPSRRT